MAFHARALSVLAYANGFTLWHYAAADLPAAEGEAAGSAAGVCRPGYFDTAADMLRAGDMILVSVIDGGRAVGAAVLLVAASSHAGVEVTGLSPPSPIRGTTGAGPPLADPRAPESR